MFQVQAGKLIHAANQKLPSSSILDLYLIKIFHPQFLGQEPMIEGQREKLKKHLHTA